MKLTKSILKELIKEQMSEIEMSKIAGAVVFNTGSKALKDADDAGKFEEMIMNNSPDTGDIDEEALYDAVRRKIGLGGGALEELIREEIAALKEMSKEEFAAAIVDAQAKEEAMLAKTSKSDMDDEEEDDRMAMPGDDDFYGEMDD